jgi:hypothetical protein
MAPRAPLSDLRFSAVLALLMIALVGCSGSEKSSDTAGVDPAQGDAASLAACSLLTAAEWENLVGPSDVAPKQTDSERTSLCAYASRQGSVLLAVERPYASDAADSQALAVQLGQDPGLSSLGDVDVQPLDGLGVPAAWYDVREAAAQIWVAAVSPSGGGTYLRVQAFGYPLERAQEIAARALSRLP